MDNLVAVEIRDVETTKEELLEAVSNRDDDIEAKLVNLRMSYSDSKTAILLIPSVLAKWLFGLVGSE